MRDTFVFSDIHGMWDLYKAIMDYCHEQDPEAMIIYCGDACDRGPDGYRIMKELLDNPYVIYLKGNHEDMFVKAAYEIKIEFHPYEALTKDRVITFLKCTKGFDYRYAAIQDTLYNGGLSTLTDWIMDGMPMDFVERINKLPLTFSTDVYDFCHAAGVYKVFKTAADAEYNKQMVDEYNANSLLWSRTAFEYGWLPNRTVIFGHTPVPYLLEELQVKCDKIQPYKYIGTFNPAFTGAKIDIDTGAAFTGIAYVLNILTMKAQGFELKDKRVEKIEVIQF